MTTTQYENFTTQHSERIMFPKNFTKKQFLRLYNGYEIWSEGTMIGMWDDREFREKYSNNKDYKYFNKVFNDYVEMDSNSWGNHYWIDIIYNSFDKERVLSEYELEEVYKEERRKEKLQKQIDRQLSNNLFQF